MVSAAGSLRNERSTCLSFSHRNRPDAIFSTRGPPCRQPDQRRVAQYETLQIVPPVSSVMNSEPSGACASPPGGRQFWGWADPARMQANRSVFFMEINGWKVDTW